MTLSWICFPHTLSLVFRNQKRSLPSSMKPGKRNCERRRQFAWRGKYWLFPPLSISQVGEMCVIRAPPPLLQFVCVLSALDDPTHSSVSVFSPLCAVCLTFFTYLSHFLSALIPSISPVSLSSHSDAQTSLSHHFSPSLSTHLWPQTSAMLPSVHRVSLVPLSACCHSTNHFSSSFLLSTQMLCLCVRKSLCKRNMCNMLYFECYS